MKNRLMRNIRNIIAGAAIIGTIAGYALVGRGMYNDQKRLDEYYSYRVAQTYRETDNNLSDASFLLMYRPPVVIGEIIRPAIFPAPNSAADRIEDALEYYHQTPEGSSDSLALDSMLEDVISELPDSTYLTSYNGQNVDNSTFEEQREEIREAREIVQGNMEHYFSVLDDEFPDEYDREAWIHILLGIFLAPVGGGVALAAQCVGLKDPYEDR